MGLQEMIRERISMDRRRLSHYDKLASSSVDGRLNSRWDRRRGRTYYYLKEPGTKREHPVREAPNAHVWKLQVKRFAAEMVRILKNNIEVMEQCAALLLPDNDADVLQQLPRAYQPNAAFRPRSKRTASRGDRGIHRDFPGELPQSENPYNPEELNIQTSFGLWVRTKGELLIAELLYSLGIEFYYERALTLDVRRTRETIVNGQILHDRYQTKKTYYPDFTIILPDGRVFYWEHKGLLKNYDYSERDILKTTDYNVNGIYQPHNYIVTEEGPENDIDFDGIKRIVQALLLC